MQDESETGPGDSVFVTSPPSPSPPPVPCCLLLPVMHLVMQIYALLCSFIACFLAIQCLALCQQYFQIPVFVLDIFKFRAKHGQITGRRLAPPPPPPPPAPSPPRTVPRPNPRPPAGPSPRPRPVAKQITQYRNRFIFAFIGSLFSSLFLSIKLISTYKYFC
jgi:hypothetical protein